MITNGDPRSARRAGPRDYRHPAVPAGRRGLPEQLQDLTVAQVGYREHDGGVPTPRVDIIDTRALVSLVSLSPVDALALADLLRAAAGAPRRGHEPGS